MKSAGTNYASERARQQNDGILQLRVLMIRMYVSIE